MDPKMCVSFNFCYAFKIQDHKIRKIKKIHNKFLPYDIVAIAMMYWCTVTYLVCSCLPE